MKVAVKPGQTTMAARTQRMLLCISVAILLLMPCYNTSRSLRPIGTRGLPSPTSVVDADLEAPRNDIGAEVPTSAGEKDMELHEWARVQAHEIAGDYNPPAANPDPGNPSPGIGD